MKESFYLVPPQASTYAGTHDAIFYFLCIVTIVFTILICILVWTFAIKFRRKGGNDHATTDVHPHPAMEAAWIGIPFVILMVMFGWGAKAFIHASNPPANAVEILVVGKQWMWKSEHPDGRREINELHVPLGQAIKLTMISQDVIHNFGIPAFRVKQDVVPGHYTTMWFEATKTGSYHLFCDQYCGTKHSDMIGTVHVLEPSEWVKWKGNMLGQSSPASEGRKLYQTLGCVACHDNGASQLGPSHKGVFGNKVKLSDGSVVTANEDYLRESILDPGAKLVAGFGPIMPSFRGRVSEEELMQLIAYLKSEGNAK